MYTTNWPSLTLCWQRLAECYQTGESPVSDEEEEGEGISAKEVAKR